MAALSTALPPIPADTVRAAETVFGSGNPYLRIGNETGRLFTEINPADLDPTRSQPAAVLARLALGTLFQYLECLPDHEAAEAVRLRTDWKYALHLPLHHPGIQPEAFCEFRRWLRAASSGQQVLGRIFGRLAAAGLLAWGARPYRDATSVLSVVCEQSRAGYMATAMHLALEAVAMACPEWLRQNSLPHWYERYSRTPVLTRRLQGAVGFEELTQSIGSDAQYLVEAVSSSLDPQLTALPEIATLRREWGRQYTHAGGESHWRPVRCADCTMTAGMPQASATHESSGSSFR